MFACLDQVKASKLRQNEAHGLLLRFNIFLSAYFQYRAIAVIDTEHVKFKSDEVLIVKSLQDFLQVLPSLTRYSKVTWALFVNTFRQIIEWVPLESKELDILKQTFAALLAEIECQKTLSLEQQSYVEELLAIRVTLCTQLGDDHALVRFVVESCKAFKDQNTDLTFVFLSKVLKKLKQVKDQTALQELCVFLLAAIQDMAAVDTSKSPNKFCKLLEVSLKVLHRAWSLLLAFAWPNHAQFRGDLLKVLKSIQQKFPKNDLFTAEIIKLQTLAARYFVRDADSF